MLAEDPNQSYYFNDKFSIGLELREKELDSVLRILSLLCKDATSDEILLLVRAVVNFCHKKGWSIGKGRPKGEESTVNISTGLYK